MNILIVILITILTGIFGALVVLFFKFRKYEPKLYAEILLESGDTVRKEITDKEETFKHENEKYNIKQNAIYQDHDILPRRTIKYIQGITNPIRPEKTSDGKRIEKGFVTPVELNYLLGIEFDKLLANEERNWKIPISKKYLLLIGIAIVVVILLAVFLPNILEQIGQETTNTARQGIPTHT